VADISDTLPEVQNSGVIGGDHYQVQLLGLSLIAKTIPQLRNIAIQGRIVTNS
jgi:hypothetical protein